MQYYIRFSLTLFPPPGSSHILGHGIFSLSSRKMVKILSSQKRAILQPVKSEISISISASFV